MNRYPRFHRDTSRFPTLFFVALFVLGTAVLGGMFVFGNRGKNNRQPTNSGPEVTTPIKPEEVVVLSAVNDDEYHATVRTAIDTFFGEALRAASVPVDDPAWEERVRAPGVLTRLDRVASRLHETLLNTRVPARARTQHLLLVVTVEELLEGLRGDRVDVMEGVLLKLKEFGAST